MTGNHLYRVTFSNEWSTLVFADTVEEAKEKATESYYCWYSAEPVIKEVQDSEITWKTEYFWNQSEQEKEKEKKELTTAERVQAYLRLAILYSEAFNLSPLQAYNDLRKKGIIK